MSQNGAALKVSTETMKAKAQMVNQQISTVKKCFSSMEATMKKTNGYWEGDAGTAYRKWFQDKKPSMDNLIARMEEHVADLEKMAGVYEAVEKQIQTHIGSLPIDQIF